MIQLDSIGDFAIEVRLDEEKIEAYLQLQEYVTNYEVSGIIEFIPCSTSLVVTYDPILFDYDSFEKLVSDYEASKIINGEQSDVYQVPICYDLSVGLDLPALSEFLKLGVQEIIDIHSSSVFNVAMFGFIPGFVYLDGLPDQLSISRKESPSLSVPGGSVAIAGRQSGIYPSAVPGGWHVIGRTPMSMINLEKKDPFPLKLGQKVAFKPISLDEFDAFHD